MAYASVHRSEPARLELAPGAGLTPVVGRNGSGDSSLAEGLAAELDEGAGIIDIASAAMHAAIEARCRRMGYEPSVLCTPDGLLEGGR